LEAEDAGLEPDLETAIAAYPEHESALRDYFSNRSYFRQAAIAMAESGMTPGPATCTEPIVDGGAASQRFVEPALCSDERSCNEPLLAQRFGPYELLNP
jgi:hypothetical protein